MKRVFWAAALTSVLALGCGEPTDLADVNLAGTWRGTVNGLGIASMTMTLTDRNSELVATGQWSPLEGGPERTFTGQGLHFGTDINLALRFQTATGPADYTTQGQVETEKTLHLVFPDLEGPRRVVFTRQ
jgi:hypothetical protein